MFIWLLTGHAGSGKTTAAAVLNRALPNSRRIAFADAVKDDVAATYGLKRHMCDTQDGKRTRLSTPEGPKTIRDLIIEHAEQEKVRTGNPGVWAALVALSMEAAQGVDHWIVHDWRFHAEKETLQACFPQAILVPLRIQRPSVVPSAHRTEHELDDVGMEIVSNTGMLEELTETLQSRAFTFAKVPTEPVSIAAAVAADDGSWNDGDRRLNPT